jgi:hypothetical protein
MTWKHTLSVGLVAFSFGCGSAGDAPAATATGPAVPATPTMPPSELTEANLPPSLGWVRFGVTTPEQVKARFTADNLFVSDHMVTRGMQPVRARGPNSGRPAGFVNVVRKTDVNGYIGALGDNYGSVGFHFTSLADGQPPVLYMLEVAQLGTAGTLCAPAAPLAAGPGLEGCDANDVYRPSAPDATTGAFHACIQHENNRTMLVHCQIASDTRIVRYELVVGQVTAAPTPVSAPAATP